MKTVQEWRTLLNHEDRSSWDMYMDAILDEMEALEQQLRLKEECIFAYQDIVAAYARREHE